MKEKIENKINELIYQANHTSDFKRWQKITAQINELRKGVDRNEYKTSINKL